MGARWRRRISSSTLLIRLMANKAYLHDPKGLGIRGNCHTNALARSMRAGDRCGATREPIAANALSSRSRKYELDTVWSRFVRSVNGGSAFCLVFLWLCYRPCYAVLRTSFASWPRCAPARIFLRPRVLRGSPAVRIATGTAALARLSVQQAAVPKNFVASRRNYRIAAPL